MSRDRYAITRVYISKYRDWRWIVLDNDFNDDMGDKASRYRLSDYSFDTAEDAAMFCDYLNSRESNYTE